MRLTVDGPRLAGTRPMRVAAGFATTVALLAGGAASAHAGTYTMDQCRLDGSTAAPKRVVADWTARGGGEFDSCSTGGAFGYHLEHPPVAAVPYGQSYWFDLAVPSSTPGVTIERLRMSYRIPPHTGNYAYFEVRTGSTVVFGEQLPADHTLNPIDVALPAGSTSINLRHFCSTAPSGPVNCSYPSFAEVFRVTQARLTLSESDAPTGSIDGGSLTTDGPKSGTRSLIYSVRDAASGIERVRVRLGSTVVADSDYGSDPAACPRDGWAACQRNREGQSVDVDTTQVPDGVHQLTLAVDDAAGNTRTFDGGEVTVDNVPPPALEPGSRPEIRGSAREGDRLEMTDGGRWTGDGVSYAYRWQRCDAEGSGCADIPGATDTGYVVSARDVERRLRLKVTASNSEGSAEGFSEASGVVQPVGQTSGGSIQPAPPSQGGQSAPGAPQSPAAPPQGRGAANGSPASDRARLAAFFGRSSRTTVRSRYGRAVRISGRLTDPGGRPISGARLSVMAKPQVKGARLDELGSTRTNRDGKFSYTVPAGPSRTVEIGYRSHTNDREFVDTTEVVVLVQAGVSLRARPRKLRNRNIATFSGRAARPLPRTGVLVDLQARVGKQWRTFAVVRTRRNGAYRYRYRFRNTFTRTVFRFRARVRRDTDYPYILGHSRIARLTVRP